MNIIHQCAKSFLNAYVVSSILKGQGRDLGGRHIECGSHTWASASRHGVNVVVMLDWGVGIAEGHFQCSQDGDVLAGNIAVVPRSESKTTVLALPGLILTVGIELFQSGYEVIRIAFVDVFDAIFIDDQSKGMGASIVSPEAGCASDWGIAKGCKKNSEVVIGNIFS